MQTFYLLVPQSTLLPVNELYELTANEAIEMLGDPSQPSGYIVRWPEVQVQLTLLDVTATARVLAEARDFATSALAGRSDAKARKNLRRVQQASGVIAVRIDPAPDPNNRARDLTLGVLAYYEDSLLWGQGALYNEQAKRFIGAEDAPVRFFVDLAPEDSPEALQRKERSLAILRREKIPFIPHLPVIVDSAQATLPALAQVVERFIALMCIAERAEGLPLAEYEARLAALGGVATPDELAFARQSAPIKEDTIKFSQRFESAWALAWALGLMPTLPRPDEFCDVEALRAWASEGADPLKRRGKLRPLSAILDMTDLHYRYHWAVNDAELYGTRVPGRLIPVVVYERHYALNWLARGGAWDAVTTDT